MKDHQTNASIDSGETSGQTYVRLTPDRNLPPIVFVLVSERMHVCLENRYFLSIVVRFFSEVCALELIGFLCSRYYNIL